MSNIHDGVIFKNNWRLEAVNYFGKRYPTEMFVRVLNTPSFSRIATLKELHEFYRKTSTFESISRKVADQNGKFLVNFVFVRTVLLRSNSGFTM